MQDNPLEQIPEISFVPKNAEQMLQEMVQKYEEEYQKQTGEKKTLPLSSKERIFLNTQALLFYQAYNLIDHAAKMNSLKYSTGNYLDNLCAMLGVDRRPPATAVSKMQFILSDQRDDPVIIPVGTRVSPGNKVFFATQEELTIPPGEMEGETSVLCQTAGTIGNGYQPGQINVLVDPIPYVGTVTNIEASQGGADLENDTSLRVRGYYALKGYSVAGPLAAYEHWVREYSQAIEGVKPFSPEPGKVDIRVTLAGGEIPTDTYLKGIYEFLMEKRPLTDQLTIQAPEIHPFALDFTYYISRRDKNKEQEIKTAVEQAAKSYLTWQEGTIGRDLNPQKLIQLCQTAGAKWVDIRSPVMKSIPDTDIFRHDSVSITYGGLEDD